jgi:hypothetical protein
MTGTDLTRIDGIDVLTAMMVIGEAGWNMSKWPSEDHFISWLRALSGQPNQWRSGDWQRAIADQQPAERSLPHGGQ